MNLAAILGFCVVSVGWLACPAFGFMHGTKPASVLVSSVVYPQAGTSSSSASQSESQAPPAQQPSSAKTPETQNPTKPAPTSLKPRKHAKKAIYSDCSNAPAVLNPTPSSTGSVTPNSDQSASGSASSSAAKNDSGKSSSAISNSRPCPLKKKIVRNGGADEPKIELEGGTPTQQASSARSTEEITAATEENLKKLKGRQLSSSEQQTISQIRQFMEESRQAVAAGDPERAQSLATKAKLLSEELLKP